MLGLIWAQARGGVIGAGGAMPWHLPEDLAHFRQVTSGATVVMGRRTWDSLPERFRPLPGRHNVVLTRRPGWSADGATAAGDLDAALAAAGQGPVWVIGGGEVYAQALPRATVVERTRVDADLPGDTWAPDLGPAWRVTRQDPRDGWHTARNGLRYRFETLRQDVS